MKNWKWKFKHKT